MIVGGRCVAGKGPSTDAALGCRPESVPCVASCAETVHANKANPKFTHEILRIVFRSDNLYSGATAASCDDSNRSFQSAWASQILDVCPIS